MGVGKITVGRLLRDKLAPEETAEALRQRIRP